MKNAIEIYENDEDGTYEVRGLGACEDGFYDPETFDTAEDAYDLAKGWEDAAKAEGIECGIVWVGYKPAWA